MKANEESVNSQFTSRVKKAQEDLAQEKAQSRLGSVKGTRASGGAHSCSSSQMAAEEDQKEGGAPLVVHQPSKQRATADEFINAFEVANLSAQLQDEVDSI